jgi:acetylornithine deacetylase/succinyl-diaminopimelate desuccinylase-like protein
MPDAELRDGVKNLMVRAKKDLAELVAFKSVADPQRFSSEECVQAAQWVRDAFAGVGLQDVETSLTADGSLAVHGHCLATHGAPTVLLYCHYDVQPPLGEAEWSSPAFELTERDGRWYGRGAADCKGNVIMHLTALRALKERYGRFPCGIKLISEGSEEQGTGGLDAFVPRNADLLRADAIIIADAGNTAVGVPTLTTSLRGMADVDIRLGALASPMHSGMFGGPAPDPVAGLIGVLATLRDARGDTTIDGLEHTQPWTGADYPAERFRSDAQVLAGVDLIGSGTVAEMLWARPSATILGIDVPPVIGSVNAIQAKAAARVSLRIPPGMKGRRAQAALIGHLRARVPWSLRCEIEPGVVGEPFVGSLEGPGFEALKAAMEEAFGHELTTTGDGASIPLCNVLAETYPEAEIFLIGVEEPNCLVHAPNESVDPREIERVALAEALFLERYAEAVR